MRKATSEDRSLILDIITKSFYDNKSVNYVIKQGSRENNIKRIKSLVDYSYKLCLSHGEIWIDDTGTGCVMFLNPHDKKTSLNSILWDAQLALECIGINRVGKVLGRESKIKKNHPSTPFIHLWFIGVLPDHQGKGIGSNLIDIVLEKAKKQGLPIYLETSVLRNLDWYKKYGFKIYNDIKFSDHTLFLLNLN